MKECSYYIELLSAALDGMLTDEQQQELAEHLATCPSCREVGPQLVAAHAAFAAMEEVPAPEGFAEGVMARVRAAENNQKKVIPLFRRPAMKAVAGLAACAVLCVGLMNGGMLPGGSQKSAAPAAAADMPASSAPAEMYAAEAPAAAAPMEPAAAAPASPAGGEYEMKYAVQTESEETVAATDGAAQDSTAGAPSHYAFANDRYIPVNFGQTPEAPSARILGSTEELEDFLARFPADDLTELAAAYGEDYFTNRRLLAVVLEESNGSITHQIDFQGLFQEQVIIARQVPEEVTDDMAAWLILAEVDTCFDGGDVLDVQLITE